MNQEGKKYLIATASFPKFGPIRLKRLNDFFSDWRLAFTASMADLRQAGIEEKIAEEFIAHRIKIEPDKLIEYLNRENIKTIALTEEDYPQLLKQIYDPPFLIYYKGCLAVEKNVLAVVGARKATPYGQKAIELIIPALVRNKITIISGLAIGIDSFAQMATVLNGGRTIGVLGSGLDKNNFYPPQNKLLAEKIIATNGALFSEFPPGTPPLKQNFPQRNRLIAGLAQATLVVEANLRSGSLITARFALEEGREVMAVPGNISFSTSEGPNNLIKQGAKIVTSADDILEFFGLKTSEENREENRKDWSGMTPEEREILVNLSSEPTALNQLTQLTKLDIKIINGTLSLLEIKGIVKNIGGGNYIII